jgi:hypothetical protein
VTADPVEVIRTVLTGQAATIGTRIRNTGPLPYIRIDPTGGTNQIPAHHDQTVNELHFIAADDKDAYDLAVSSRALLDAAKGVIGDAVVSKILTSPPRLRDHSEGKGWVSFPARVFLHPA